VRHAGLNQRRQIAFIILTKSKKRQQEVRKLLYEYVRSNLQILD
jgi:hypothetical protein